MIYFISNQRIIETDAIKNSTIDYLMKWVENKSVIEIDTETTGSFNFYNRILSLQIGNYDDQFVLYFPSLTKEDKEKINSILVSDKIKILQNAKFDIKFLWLEGLKIYNIYDTMLAECILNAGKDTPKGFYALDSIANRYLGVELDKSIRGLIKKEGFSYKVIQYAAEDVKYLSKIRELQMEELQNWDLASNDCQDKYTVLGLENRVTLVFAEMEYVGMKIDHNKWAPIKDNAFKRVDDAEQSILEEIERLLIDDEVSRVFGVNCQVNTDIFGNKISNINWGSPQQKLKLLQIIDPNIQSTNERELTKYKKVYPIVDKLINYNKAKKFLTAFAKSIPESENPKTGRIHTNFWQILKTGRPSSSKPNLLNIPSRTKEGALMRAAFIPENGYKIVGGDYAGCELRLLAMLSQDPFWVDIFLNNKDLHSELCALTFNIPIENVRTYTDFKPDLKYRDVQKTINFG